MANPIVIVLFQLLITRLFGKMKPIRSIVIGTVIIGLSMAINPVPVFTSVYASRCSTCCHSDRR